MKSREQRQKKALPSLCLHDMNIQFKSATEAQKLRDLLQEEPLLEIVTEPQSLSKAEADRRASQASPLAFRSKLYLITRLGSLVMLTFDIQEQAVTSLQTSAYVKSLLGAFPIQQIQVTQGSGHLQLAMLVEHDCLCMVQVSKPAAADGATSPMRLEDLLKHGDTLPTAYGLTQVDVKGVTQLALNHFVTDNQCVLVANEEMLEVFRTKLVEDGGEVKIEFVRVLMVAKNDLPVVLVGGLAGIRFDMQDRNVFYAIGSANDRFEESQAGERPLDEEEKALRQGMPAQFRIEKFFIDCEETFQSQTMCTLDIPLNPQRDFTDQQILSYSISEGHDLVACATSDQSVYVYSLAQLRARFLAKQRKMESQDLQQVKDLNEDPLALDESGSAQKVPQMRTESSVAHPLDDPSQVDILSPIAQRRNVGEEISELKWAFNDALLIAVTVTNKVIAMDPLCHVFSLILPAATDTALGRKFVTLTPAKSLGSPPAEDQQVCFCLKGGSALINSDGFPVVTPQKYLAAFYSDVEAPEQPTYLKLLYFDTSPTYFVDGVAEKFQVTGESPLSQCQVARAHLHAGRVQHVARFALDVIQEPDQWFTTCMYLVNYMLRNVKALRTQKVQSHVWLQLYQRCQENDQLRFYEESLGFCLIRLGLKYLSLNMIDDALYLAFNSKISQLVKACELYAHKKGAPLLTNLISYHEERADPGKQSNLIKAMSQLANFTGKQLRKEDYNNLYKDFETLCKIDDITDLELKDFNSWEINLEEYQRALDLEFEGYFKEAEKIYQSNNIKNDVYRAQNLQKEFTKELREGEKYLTLVNMNELMKDFQQSLIQAAYKKASAANDALAAEQASQKGEEEEEEKAG